MPFHRYNPSYIEGTLEPILPNLFRALLCLFSFGSFFSFFSSITMLNIPFTYSTASSPILTPITLNCCIYQVIAHLNQWERCKK